MEPSRVQVDVRTVAHGRVVVRLAGELDIAEADGVRRLLVAHVRPATVVAVDLADLSFIDLQGVRALHDAQRAAAECGSPLLLVSPPRCLMDLVCLMDLGQMPLSDDRSVLGEPRSRRDEWAGSVRRRPSARGVRVDGARAWRASPPRPPGPGGFSCSPDDRA
jgi:anti-sigma B factor antagonist